jgi:hypothetical protein
MGSLLKSLLISAVLVAFATSSDAEFWSAKLNRALKLGEPAIIAEPTTSIHASFLQKGSLVAGGGNAICFPASTFIPNIPPFQYSSILSAADVKFYFADYSTAAVPPIVFVILAGKCFYVFFYQDFYPGAAEIALLVDQHSPNVYFVVSRKDDCRSVIKTSLDDPVFSDVEFSCNVNFHGIFVK